ncbi:MAG: hypothetical protein Q7T40_01115 [Methylobacter sp.]|nr:hypothetical protein [Methylobacter sp.]
MSLLLIEDDAVLADGLLIPSDSGYSFTCHGRRLRGTVAIYVHRVRKRIELFGAVD